MAHRMSRRFQNHHRAITKNVVIAPEFDGILPLKRPTVCRCNSLGWKLGHGRLILATMHQEGGICKESDIARVIRVCMGKSYIPNVLGRYSEFSKPRSKRLGNNR